MVDHDLADPAEMHELLDRAQRVGGGQARHGEVDVVAVQEAPGAARRQRPLAEDVDVRPLREVGLERLDRDAQGRGEGSVEDVEGVPELREDEFLVGGGPSGVLGIGACRSRSFRQDGDLVAVCTSRPSRRALTSLMSVLRNATLLGVRDCIARIIIWSALSH